MPDEREDLEFEYQDEGETSGDALKKLREKLRKCTEEKEEYLAGWQRAKADLINANRASKDESSRSKSRAHEEIVTDLLPVLDSFTMAMSNKEVWEKADPTWRQGIEYILTQLSKTLSEYGLEEIETKLGEHVSFEIHHPLKTISTDEQSQDDTVANIIQKGYKFNGTVIRPVTVSVYRYEA